MLQHPCVRCGITHRVHAASSEGAAFTMVADVLDDCHLRASRAEVNLSDEQGTSPLGLVLGSAEDVWSVHSPGANQELAQLDELWVWFPVASKLCVSGSSATETLASILRNRSAVSARLGTPGE
jgi:hypothetical protein